ncbi:YcxB family protein [Clostridium sp. D53t1_180928_C8]|uniref:YcxB family protein n=1 Tax=Clostridium sp. D53t1_180928_C8 TaxID=2787101 RepID=UPI0018AA81E8|nr:YcxB family protein [Clostridium sp. D53t1_180928_C8]
MKFIYTNTIDQYTNCLKAEKLKLKILKKIFPIIFLIIFLIACFFWFNHKITNIQIILVSFETLIPAIFFIYIPEIYFSISSKIIKRLILSYKVLPEKELEICENEIIYKFSNNHIDKFSFNNIKNILEFEDCIYIFRSDNNSLIYTPIIPNSVFENEESKKEFIELLSKK